LRANGTSAAGDEIISSAAGVVGVQQEARPRPPCIFIIGR
jgi:hypothetical protein